MSDLAQGYTADVVLQPGDSVRVSTVGQATVRSAYGAPAGTTTLNANTQTFGPYGVPAKLTITAVSGTANYAQPTQVPVTYDPSTGVVSSPGAVSGAGNQRLPLAINGLSLRPAEPLKQLDIPSPIATTWNAEHAYFRAVYGGQNGWNGYKYWACGAPYPSTSAAPGDLHRFESPCIYVSQDGDAWIQAPGANNPVIGLPATGDYRNHTLVLSNDRSKLYLVVEWAQGAGTQPGGNSSGIVISETSNGVTWSTPVYITGASGSNQTSSPSMWQTSSGGWAIMYQNTGTGGYPTYLITTSSATPYSGWGAPQAVTITHPLSRTWWRHHAVMLPSGQLVGFSQDNDSSGGSVYSITSSDGGLTWSVAQFSQTNSASAVNSWYAPCLCVAHDGVAPTFIGFFCRVGPMQQGGFWIQKARLVDDFPQLAASNLALLDMAKRQVSLGGVAAIADSFTRADSAVTPGSADVGGAYTVDNGTFGISTNRLYSVTTGNVTLWIDSKLTDFNAQCVIDTPGTQFYIRFNVSSTSPSDTYWRFGVNGSNPKLQRIAGGAAVTDKNWSGTVVAGDRLRVMRKDNTITLFHNDRVIDTLVDANYANNTRVGLQAGGASATYFRSFTVTPA